MKVKTKQQGGLALDPRTTAFFNKGDVLEVGDKGLSEENLERLIEIGFAEEVNGDVQPEEVEALPEEVDSEEAEPEYKSFTKKSDLEAYAKEEYGIDLDKRLTLAGMVEQLETEIGE